MVDANVVGRGFCLALGRKSMIDKQHKAMPCMQGTKIQQTDDVNVCGHRILGICVEN